MQFGIGHPPTYTSIAVYMCGRGGSRVPNLQTEFNYLDSFKSYGIFSDFVVPVVPTSSPCHPRHPHIIPIAPRRSPCGPHGCGLRVLLHGLRGLHPMLSPFSPWSLSSPHHPCHPHVIPTSSLSSPHHPHIPQKVPMWCPWLWSPWSPPLSSWSPPHVVPVFPVVPVISTSSLLSQHHLRVIPVVPTSSP